MDAYLDLRLRPDPEMSAELLMNSLFAKLHRRLVSQKPLQIGMSFPDYAEEHPSLGRVMRLHGAKPDLLHLMNEDWCGGLLGYLRVAEISTGTGRCFVSVRRVQTKSSPARLARRYQSRHGINEKDGAARYANARPVLSKLPFLTVKSASSDHHFRLFIRQRAEEKWSMGEFNRYGLSRDATIAYP